MVWSRINGTTVPTFIDTYIHTYIYPSHSLSHSLSLLSLSLACSFISVIFDSKSSLFPL